MTDNSKSDKLHEIRLDVEDTKQVMIKNIDKTLQNVESIESLNSKTNDLQKNAKMFEKRSKRLKWNEYMKNCRFNITIILIVLILILIFIGPYISFN